MHRVWFGGRPSVGPDIVSVGEMGNAPFVLLIEYVPPRWWGTYRLKAQIVLRDRKVLEIIRRHQLDSIELYVDKAAEAVDERQTKLGEDFVRMHDGPAFALSPHLWVSPILRQIGIAYDQQRVVRVSFGKLLRGIEVKGELDELSWLARELTQAIDRLAAKIDTARAFDINQVRIYAPGDKQKPVKGKPGKPGMPPSQWGR